MRLDHKIGDILHLRLNIGKEPIVDKYREGKMKRTLKRELKVSEIANGEALVNHTLCVRRTHEQICCYGAEKFVVALDLVLSLELNWGQHQ